MAIEENKTAWFECVSPLVRCENCKNWKEPSAYERHIGERQGMCSVIVAYGGAWHNAGTEADFFCQEFELKKNVG